MSQTSKAVELNGEPQDQRALEVKSTPSQNAEPSLSHIEQTRSTDEALEGAQNKLHKRILQDEYLPGVLFFPCLGVALLISMVVYASAHGLNYFTLWYKPLKFSVDFIGGERNAYTVGVEASVWAFWGVTCHIAYIALEAILNKTFRFFKYMAIWFGTVGFAWGVSVALILSLSIISINIGTTQITLADASIETIMAIAFIIGFFNKYALKLLEQVRDRLTGGMSEESISK